jgi:hypothetical protein
MSTSFTTTSKRFGQYRSTSALPSVAVGGRGSAAKSRFLAVLLTLGTATTLTAAQSIAMPSPAEAGIFSSIKGAAKKVGGAVANTAEGIGEAGKAAGRLGRQVGVGVGSNVKRGAVAVGREAAKLPPVKMFIDRGREIRRSF